MTDSLPAAIETVFLDAGNTLISMDYEWVARELARAGHTVDVTDLARAEAAARPATSRFVARQSRQSGMDSYLYYLARIVERLPAIAALPAGGREALVRAIAARLKRPGGDHRLWSQVLPGVPEALRSLRHAGFRLIVVSNSDGSVERALVDLGLAADLDAILDSEIVGFEKPDPRFFLHALDIAEANPAQTLHVGDMYYQDVLGARGAGIACVLLDPFGDWPDADCVRRPDLGAVAAELVAARGVRSAPAMRS